MFVVLHSAKATNTCLIVAKGSGDLLKYILRRAFSMLAVVLVSVTIIFTLMSFAPGDPALIILGESTTPETITELDAQLGLDDPFFIRLGKYVLGLFQGDFGQSYKTRGPVLDEILARYPVSLILAFGSTIIGVIIGVAVGVVSAVKQYSWADRIFTAISLFGASAPSFWIGMVLIMIFSLHFGWLPATGSYGPTYWILPLSTLGLQCSATIMRMTRSAMLEEIRQDYIRTAHSKGQTGFKVTILHGLRNAMLPILTITGLKLCDYLSGTVVLETVFALPGIGSYIVASVSVQDFPAIQGVVIWISLNCALITFAVDMLYGLVDPRIRTTYGAQKRRKLKKSIKNGDAVKVV